MGDEGWVLRMTLGGPERCPIIRSERKIVLGTGKEDTASVFQHVEFEVPLGHPGRNGWQQDHQAWSSLEAESETSSAHYERWLNSQERVCTQRLRREV